jgi:hypothetical protein
MLGVLASLISASVPFCRSSASRCVVSFFVLFFCHALPFVCLFVWLFAHLCFKQLGLAATAGEVSALFLDLDSDGNGSVDYAEFLNWYLDVSTAVTDRSSEVSGLGGCELEHSTKKNGGFAARSFCSSFYIL